jgi:uncharacterized caspase-like protein
MSWSKAKYAFVIGNDAYKSGRFKTPVNDAVLMGNTLKKLGFELIKNQAQANLNKEKMSELLIRFRR